jgi:hypothetical protein
MLVIALALVLIAAAAAAVLMDASRSMLPAVNRTAPLDQAAPAVAVQRTAETSPDAQADAARAYGFASTLPAEPRNTVQIAL